MSNDHIPEELRGEYDDLEDYLSDDCDEDVAMDYDLRAAGTLEQNFSCLVVVDNVPVIPGAKAKKLEAVLTKIFSQFGEFQEGGFSIPLEERDGSSFTRGFAYIGYKEAEAAAQAVQLANGFKLDKKHVFQVNLYTDLSKFGPWPDVHVEPERPEFEAPENKLGYLLDAAGRDQYVTRQGPETEIFFCEGMQLKGEGTLVYGGERERAMGKVWCELYTAWSPLGTYMATYHRQGIALWGGSKFKKIRRFAHSDVQCLEFSPCENFIVTWDGKDNNQDLKSLQVWETATGKPLRAFKVTPGSVWPIMKWSHDDKLFARSTTDGIMVYETPSMKLLQKKPVRAKGMVEFSWCPGRNVIAYWSPEAEDKPARVVIIDPVSRKEVRAKNLFSVSEVKLHWQDRGDFLCAQVLRHTKSGKTTFTNLEIFRMNDANIPNETVDLKERVENFAWEPGRERFGVIHGDSQIRFSISFYSMGKLKGGKAVEKLYTVEDKQANLLFWSPLGNAVVMAGMQSVEVKLEFFDVDERITTSAGEHFMCNEICWDPSGRMVATIATQPMFGTVGVREKLGNGFNLWTFQGNRLKAVQTQHFYQFAWRPRPKSQLKDEEKVEVVKNLKDALRRYEREDGVRKKLMNAAANAEKLRALTIYRDMMAGLNATYEADVLERQRLGLWAVEESTEYIEIEEVVEEVLSEKTSPYPTP